MIVWQRPGVTCYSMTPVSNMHVLKGAMLRVKRSIQSDCTDPNGACSYLPQMPPSTQAAFARSLECFRKVSRTRDVTVTFHRILVPPNTEKWVHGRRWGNPEEEDGMLGVLCVSRDNVSGALHRFRWPEGFFMREVCAGELVVFDRQRVQHSVETPMITYPLGEEEGIADFIVFEGHNHDPKHPTP